MKACSGQEEDRTGPREASGGVAGQGEAEQNSVQRSTHKEARGEATTSTTRTGRPHDAEEELEAADEGGAGKRKASGEGAGEAEEKSTNSARTSNCASASSKGVLKKLVKTPFFTKKTKPKPC